MRTNNIKNAFIYYENFLLWIFFAVFFLSVIFFLKKIQKGKFLLFNSFFFIHFLCYLVSPKIKKEKHNNNREEKNLLRIKWVAGFFFWRVEGSEREQADNRAPKIYKKMALFCNICCMLFFYVSYMIKIFIPLCTFLLYISGVRPLFLLINV